MNKLLLLVAFMSAQLGCAFVQPYSETRSRSRHGHVFSSIADQIITTDKKPSSEWELDCYSRPVLVEGKKLWEVLLTDSTGSFRYCKTLASNQVNSKELRRVVESVMDEADVKPSTIRFFRGAMFNMVRKTCSDCTLLLECPSSLCTNSAPFLSMPYCRSILHYLIWK